MPSVDFGHSRGAPSASTYLTVNNALSPSLYLWMLSAPHMGNPVAVTQQLISGPLLAWGVEIEDSTKNPYYKLIINCPKHFLGQQQR